MTSESEPDRCGPAAGAESQVTSREMVYEMTTS
jgi:hypothetical protein